MRVIRGVAKGRILKGPKGLQIRPASDKVKQAIFNVLGDVRGKRVLDLFAGTGSIGIEALSRGAAQCTFVDGSREGVELIHKNLRNCRLENFSSVIFARIPAGLRRALPQFNLIFVDPPYDQDLVNPTLRAVARQNLLAPGGTVVVEHSPREAIAGDCGLTLTDQRKYGQTLVSFLTSPHPSP